MSHHAGQPTETYQWGRDSVIDKIVFRGTGDVAYLHASTLADEEKLDSIKAILREHELSLSPASYQNAPVLRVSGLDNPEQLLKVLSPHYLAGQPHITKAQKPKEGFWEGIKNNTLHASGVVYLLGDAVSIFSGLWGGQQAAQIATGSAFALGDIGLMAFGKPSEERLFKQLMQDLKQELKQKGVEIPSASALNTEALTQRGGFLESIHEFMCKNANKIKIMAEVVGGVFTFITGISKDKHGEQNPGKIRAGIMLMVGWAASLLIQEKKIDRDGEAFKQANPLERFVMEVQNKPLSIAATSSVVNNAFTIAGAMEKKKQHQHDGKSHTGYNLDIAYSLIFLAGNGLYAASRKTPGARHHQDNALINDMYGIVMEGLAGKPRDKIETAIETVADYLSKRPEVKETKAQIIERLHQELESHQQNPWNGRHYTPPLVGAERGI